jgi:hypothetical protein
MGAPNATLTGLPPGFPAAFRQIGGPGWARRAVPRDGHGERPQRPSLELNREQAAVFDRDGSLFPRAKTHDGVVPPTAAESRYAQFGHSTQDLHRTLSRGELARSAIEREDYLDRAGQTCGTRVAPRQHTA